MTRTFLLPPDQLSRVFEAGGPLVEMGATADRLQSMRIAVVEVDGRIVAYWVAWYGLHVEPLWVHPDHRHSPAVGGGLLETMAELVRSTGEPAAYCSIEDANLPLIQSMADRVGFHRAPGSLYYLVVPPAPPEKG